MIRVVPSRNISFSSCFPRLPSEFAASGRKTRFGAVFSKCSGCNPPVWSVVTDDAHLFILQHHCVFVLWVFSVLCWAVGDDLTPCVCSRHEFSTRTGVLVVVAVGTLTSAINSSRRGLTVLHGRAHAQLVFGGQLLACSSYSYWMKFMVCAYRENWFRLSVLKRVCVTFRHFVLLYLKGFVDT